MQRGLERRTAFLAGLSLVTWTLGTKGPDSWAQAQVEDSLGAPAVAGQVHDGDGHAVAGVKLVLGCVSDRGGRARVETDEAGSFALGRQVPSSRECTVRSVDLEDGLVPIVEEVRVPGGETVRLDLDLRRGTPVTVTVWALGRPVEHGTVTWVGGAGMLETPVEDGEAHFSGLPGPGGFFFQGRVDGIPEGQAAGCRLLADLFPDAGPIDPGTGSPPLVDLADLDLRPVRVTLAESSEGLSIRLSLGEVSGLGSLDRVSVAPGDVVFPCVPPGEPILEVFRGHEVQLTRRLEVAPGEPPIELLDLEVRP